MARYDGIAEWYDVEFLGSVDDPGADALLRLLGPPRGKLLDVGCGTGAKTLALRDRGWDVTGALPFADASFDAAVSLWTHTDVDDFSTAVREVARVLRPGARFVYVGGHPCFIGPHSRFIHADGAPELHRGYLDEARYGLEAPGVGAPDGLRAKVGAVHLTLASFLHAFLDAGLALERFEELALEGRPYPFTVALRWRR